MSKEALFSCLRPFIRKRVFSFFFFLLSCWGIALFFPTSGLHAAEEYLVGSVVHGPVRSSRQGNPQYATANFTVVNAPTPELARDFCETAERCRADLARYWLGKTLPDWSAPCPIRVNVGTHLGAGGSTSFIFADGEVYGWEMAIQGSAERILDAVLPHEITHMIFASHFRTPLPRWLDEGGATSVECSHEKSNYRRMLLRFIDEKVAKCLPFNKMVALKEYPDDPMPLYAQGFSVVEFLLAQGGPRMFMRFAERGMRSRDWSLAVRECYGYEDLGELQELWTRWVGSNFSDVAAFMPASSLLESFSQTDVTMLPTVSVSESPAFDPLQSLAASSPAPPYAAARVLPGPVLEDEQVKSSTVLLEWSRHQR